MNKYWWAKLVLWLFTGRWPDITCTPCMKGIHPHEMTTGKCITRGCDCKTEEA